MQVLRAAKRTTLQAMSALGLFDLVRQSAWRRGRLLILCYHGISLDDEHEWDASLYMSPAVFERRLETIARGGYDVLPLQVALERLYEQGLERPTIAITFDDGVYDFYARAHPRLEQYGFPSTVYLTTYYCEHQEPVFPAFCWYLLWKGRRHALDSSGILDARGPWELATTAGRWAVFDAIVEHANRHHLSASQKTALARAIAQRLGIDFDLLIGKRILHLLNAREVAELSRKGVDFQLHTHRHYTPPHRALFLREIEQNRASIRNMAGSDPTHFCYPSGVHDPGWLGWLADAGVTSATTTLPGLATPSANPLLLPRLVDTNNVTPLEFEAWLSGAGALLPRRRRAVPRPLSEQIRIDSEIARFAQTRGRDGVGAAL